MGQQILERRILEEVGRCELSVAALWALIGGGRFELLTALSRMCHAGMVAVREEGGRTFVRLKEGDGGRT